MDIAGISSQLASTGLDPSAQSANGRDPAKLAKVSRQFESILVRQILSESMKPLLQGGPSGQVYGYMLTDSLADRISAGAASG